MEKRLSSNLAWLLKRNELTTAGLSRRCGIAQPVVHRLVAGTINNPQIDTLLGISQYFNCSIDALLFQDFSANPFDAPITQNEARHAIRNNLAVITSLLQGLKTTLPIFTGSYLALPQEFRTGEISEEMISMIPTMLAHSITAISNLKKALDHL